MTSTKFFFVVIVSLGIFILMFSCEAPVVDRCDPIDGAMAGDEEVTIIGKNLQKNDQTTIRFNGVDITIPDTQFISDKKVKITTPGGPAGQVAVQAYTATSGYWSLPENKYTYLSDEIVPIRYRIPGTTFPVDCSMGYHVRGGKLDAVDPEIDVIAFSDGPAGPSIIWNESHDGEFIFTKDESAIPWTWDEGGSQTKVSDAIFLDIDNDADNIADALYVAVSGVPGELKQDHIYLISDGQFIQQPVGDFGLPEDTHSAKTAIASRDIDGTDTLYVILAGGDYLSKTSPGITRRTNDSLRILRSDYDGVNPDTFLKFSEVNPEDIFDSIPNSVMMDVDILFANDDQYADLIVSVYPCNNPGLTTCDIGHDRTELLLNQTGASGDPIEYGWTMEYDLLSYGAVVGDFDSDNDEDVIVFHTDGNNPLAVYENKRDTEAFERVAAPFTGNWPDYGLNCVNNKGNDAVTLEDADGDVTHVVVAGQFPYILVNDSLLRNSISFHLVDQGDWYNPEKFNQAYSSEGVLVSDFNDHGAPDIVFADSTEQNRLWECEYIQNGSGQQELTPVDEATQTYLPSGGEMSTKVLSGDLDGDGYMDIVVVNMSFPPNIYMNNVGNGEEDKLIDGSGYFHDSQYNCNDHGGLDGVLMDFDGDDCLDLVIAGGAYNDKKKPNQMYRWCGSNEFQTCGSFPECGSQVGFYPVPNAFPDDLILHTSGVAAADLDDGEYPDLVFSNTSGAKATGTAGIMVLYNCERNGQYGYFNNCTGNPQNQYQKIASPGEAYRSVAIVNKPNGYPDIIAGGVLGNINIYRNLHQIGGNYRSFGSEEPVLSSTDGDLLGAVTRFIPMDLDDPAPGTQKNDFFVAIQESRNVLLRSDSAGGFEDASLGNISWEVRASWGGAAYDLNNDGLDDILLANCSGGQSRVYLSNDQRPGELNQIMEDQQDTWFSAFRSDGFTDAMILDLFGDSKPEIVMVGDGQNRLLLPDW